MFTVDLSGSGGKTDMSADRTELIVNGMVRIVAAGTPFAVAKNQAGEV